MFKCRLEKCKTQENIVTRTGFTLVELVVVIIIIGILTSIGLPVYNKVIEKTRSREALVGLRAIYNAQMRYALKHGTYYFKNNQNNLSGLDINIANPGKYYYFSIGTNTIFYDDGDPTGLVAWAWRWPGLEYCVAIRESGDFRFYICVSNPAWSEDNILPH